MSKLAFNQSIEDSNLSHINTEIIHPIAINQDTCTFNITNRGGSLDKHTSVVIPVVCADVGAEVHRKSFLPINVGIGSILKSCQLISNSGGQVLCSNNNVPMWLALSHSFQQQEFRKRVLKCRHGIFEDYGPSRAGAMITNGGPNTAVPNACGRLSINNLSYPFDYAGTSGLLESSVGQLNAQNTVANDSFENEKNRNYRIEATSDTTCNLYLSLEALFPKMYNGLELPIQFLEAGVSLVLQFSKNGTRMNTNERGCISSLNLQNLTAQGGGGAGAQNMNISILTDEVVLLTDYLVAKDDNMLASQIMSDQGLTLQFGDLLWNNFYMDSLDTCTSERNYKRYNFQLGASNEVIRQMYMFFSPTQNNDVTAKPAPQNTAGGATAGTNRGFAYSLYNEPNCLKNIYCSKQLSHLSDGERIQIKINQQNLFPQPLENNGEKLHHLQMAYGSSFCKPQSTYEITGMVKGEGDQISYPNTVNGTLLLSKSIMSPTSSIQGWSNQNLVNSNHFIGINLQKPLLSNDGRLVRSNISGSGTRIGPTPIMIEIDRLQAYNQPNDNRDMHVCCVIERTLNIRMGDITVVDN